MSNELVTQETPVEVKPLNGGAQAIFHFPNGYGASVVRSTNKWGETYGASEGLWELAVIKFSPASGQWEMCYDTEITNDVIGWLEPEDVDELLTRIKALPA